MTIILTSDDFGLSSVFNEKILEMLRNRYLTSVSVMVHRITSEQSDQIKELIRLYENDNISIGLHLELPEIGYMDEVQSQFILFKSIFGFAPDYLDLHKRHQFKGDLEKLSEFCVNNHLAIRKYPLNTDSVASPDFSILTTYIDTESLLSYFDDTDNDHIYEFIFHIGVYDPNSRSRLNRERELDITKLISVNQLIEQNQLKRASYKDLLAFYKTGE